MKHTRAFYETSKGDRGVLTHYLHQCPRAGDSDEEKRHSFTMHLLEGGTATRSIQVLLGHELPKTTEIYAHVTRFALDKIQSPLDQVLPSSGGSSAMTDSFELPGRV